MEQDLTNQYNTPLNTFEQAQYDMMFTKNDSYDYDMQGWFKANPDQDPHDDGTHYPDDWKKPNHPTFSDQSIYHGVDGNNGGHWNTDEGTGTENFAPGDTNLQQHGTQGLQDYFNTRETGVQLLLPGS